MPVPDPLEIPVAICVNGAIDGILTVMIHVSDGAHRANDAKGTTS